MELRTYDSAAALLEDTGEYLAAREAEHNLQLAILGTLRDQPDVYKEPPYLAAVWDREHVALVASRTPPFDLVLSEPGVPDTAIPAALEILVGDLALRDPGLPGVLGPPGLVGGLVERWQERTGVRAANASAERIFRLTAVRPPPMPPGRWRFASDADRGLLARWVIDFNTEALEEEQPLAEVEKMVDRWIRREGRIAYLGGRWAVRVAGGDRTADSHRHPGRARLHAASRSGTRLRERADRSGQPGPARRRPRVLLPLHGPCQPDLEHDLPGHRLRARRRCRALPVHTPGCTVRLTRHSCDKGDRRAEPGGR